MVEMIISNPILIKLEDEMITRYNSGTAQVNELIQLQLNFNLTLSCLVLFGNWFIWMYHSVAGSFFVNVETNWS